MFTSPHMTHTAMPRTVAELLDAAADALIRRDAETIVEIAAHASEWLQHEDEEAAQGKLLDAMIEAAMLLKDEPSELAPSTPLKGTDQ